MHGYRTFGASPVESTKWRVMKKLLEDEHDNLTNNILPIRVWDTLNLDRLDSKHLKFVFHKDNWGKTTPTAYGKKFENDDFWGKEQSFDDVLFNIYCHRSKEDIEKMTTLRGEPTPRLKADDLAFNLIPYPFGKRAYLLVTVFRVVDAKLRIVEKIDLPEYEPYLGRLVISIYETKTKRWLTLSDPKKIKKLKVAEILSTPADQAFPGYDGVRLSYKKLEENLEIPEWTRKLKDRKGIYVITDTNNGKQYVGAAYGQNGIYGRWSAYVDSPGNINNVSDDITSTKSVGYPNKDFREIILDQGRAYIEKYFQYTILETFDRNTPKKVIVDREIYWKKVLKTKEFGYNEN